MDPSDEVKRNRLELVGTEDGDNAEALQQFPVHKATSIPEVAEQIFQFLSFPDLLSCSLVSKAWNFHARSCLRRLRRCLLFLSLEEDFYGHFTNLISMMENCTHIPFSGLYIVFPRTSPSRLYESALMNRCWESLATVLLEKFEKCRFFRLECGEARKKAELRGIEKIISAIYEQLEVLELVGEPPCGSGLLSGEPPPILWNLRELEFDFVPNVAESTTSWAMRIAAAAPNLRRMRGYLTVDWLTAPSLVQTLKSKLVVSGFDSQFSLLRMFRAFHQFVQQEHQLERLRFSYLSTRPRSHHHRLWSSLAVAEVQGALRIRLLENTRVTLKHLTIAHEDLLRIAFLRVLPVCPNLRVLKIYISGLEAGSPEILLNHVDFPTYFPRLERLQVIIVYCTADERRTHAQEEEFPQCLGNFISNSVSTLEVHSNISLEGGRSTAALIFRLAQLFPRLRHLYVHQHKSSGAGHFLQALWTVWPELETMTLTVTNLMCAKESFDATYCGLSVEEVQELKLFEGDLRSLHVVPTAPSILNKSRLRILRLQIEQGDGDRRDDPGRFLLSEISGIFAFSRIQGLTIEIYTVGSTHVHPNYRFNLDHLKPYVKLQCRNRRLVMKNIRI